MGIRKFTHRLIIGLVGLVMVGVWSVILVFASASAAAADAPPSFNIPSESLFQALRDYGRTTGRQISFTEDLVRGRTVAALSGAYSPEAALDRLLEGTGLTAQFTPSGAIMILKESGKETDTTPAQSTSLAEITVTAQKRTENLQDVPSGVTALPAIKLEEDHLVKLQDYAGLVPGLVVNDAATTIGGVSIAIRGISDFGGGAATVGIVVDDAPVGALVGRGSLMVPDLDPANLSQVEVLKGPQGTLYGGGSMGGLLKYVTASPDSSHFFGRIAVDGSQIDGGEAGYGVRGSANIPLNDDLAMRVSGFVSRDPGFINDSQTGQRNINTDWNRGGHLAIEWRPNSEWKFRLSGLVQDRNADGSAFVDYDNNTQQPLYGKFGQQRIPGVGLNDQFDSTTALRIEGDLGWATLVSVTAYNNQQGNYDIDFTPVFGGLAASSFNLPSAGISFSEGVRVNKVSQEIRISSPVNQQFSWQLGAFYTDERNRFFNSDVVVDQNTGSAITTVPSFFKSTTFNNYREGAGFGDVTYQITSRLNITAGLRVSAIEQTNDGFTSGFLTGASSPTPFTSPKATATPVTYLVTPTYHFTDDVMVYARYATAFRSGGANSVSPGVPLTYGPDEVDNYELGIRSELFDKRLRLNVSIYDVEWNKIQVLEVTPDNDFYTGNAGKGQIQGVEIESAWKPLPGLMIEASGNYTSAQLKSGLDPATDTYAPPGSTIPAIPKWSGEIAAHYDVPLVADWIGLVGASFRYVGSALGNYQSISTPQLARFRLVPYNVANLNLGFKHDSLTFTVYVHNLANSIGQTSDNNYGPYNEVAVTQPRTFGFSVAKEF